jgi:hypothetical protein
MFATSYTSSELVLEASSISDGGEVVEDVVVNANLERRFDSASGRMVEAGGFYCRFLLLSTGG